MLHNKKRKEAFCYKVMSYYIFSHFVCPWQHKGLSTRTTMLGLEFWRSFIRHVEHKRRCNGECVGTNKKN